MAQPAEPKVENDAAPDQVEPVEGTTADAADNKAQQPNAADDQSDQKEKPSTFADKLSAFGAKVTEVVDDLGNQLNARLTMEGQLKAAQKHLGAFLNPQIDAEKQIPVKLMEEAQGIVFLSAIKASIGVGGSVGSGVIIAKLENGGWSGPCSIGLAGGQWGFNIGAQKTDFVIILRDKKAVQLFSGKGQVKFGADASIAAGPLGRDAQLAVGANKQGYAATVSYSMAKGLYVGFALEGQGIMARDDCNEKFYGKKVEVKDILGNAAAVENDDYDGICALLNSYIDGQKEVNGGGAKQEIQEDEMGGGDKEEEAKQPL